jgi:hypothetical protein
MASSRSHAIAVPPHWLQNEASPQTGPNTIIITQQIPYVNIFLYIIHKFSSLNKNFLSVLYNIPGCFFPIPVLNYSHKGDTQKVNPKAKKGSHPGKAKSLLTSNLKTTGKVNEPEQVQWETTQLQLTGSEKEIHKRRKLQNKRFHNNRSKHQH